MVYDGQCLMLSTTKIISKTLPVLPYLSPLLIFPFSLLPSPVYPTGFSIYIFSGLIVIVIMLSSNNNHFRAIYIVYVLKMIKENDRLIRHTGKRWTYSTRH